MKIIHLPEAGASEHEIVASLKYRYRLVICFTGCDMATPGCKDQPGTKTSLKKRIKELETQLRAAGIEPT